jgi:hypothetical protein
VRWFFLDCRWRGGGGFGLVWKMGCGVGCVCVCVCVCVLEVGGREMVDRVWVLGGDWGFHIGWFCEGRAGVGG